MSTTTQALTAAGFVAAGVVIGLLWRIRRQLQSNQEQIMAKFEGLDTDIAALKTAVGDAATRVETALAALSNDDADQAEIEQARAEVQASVEALRAIAAAPTPPPVEPPVDNGPVDGPVDGGPQARRR